eukprot:jgi/Mesen1/4585/ME000232S03836
MATLIWGVSLVQIKVQNAQNAQYRGMLSGLRTIWAAEGLKGFFKGNGTNCARIVPNSAVKFYAYEQASHRMRLSPAGWSCIPPLNRRMRLWDLKMSLGEHTELTPLLRLGAGATAGIIAMSATYPMDMVRGRITVQVPYVGLNFAVYETLKDMVAKQQPGGGGQANELSVLTKLACGAAAGTVGQTVAYPLDVVRRRLQMVGWKDAVHGTTAYSGMLDAFSKTVKNEGVSALYRGLLPNSVKVRGGVRPARGESLSLSPSLSLSHAWHAPPLCEYCGGSALCYLRSGSGRAVITASQSLFPSSVVPSIAIAFVTYELMKDVMGVEIRISD